MQQDTARLSHHANARQFRGAAIDSLPLSLHLACMRSSMQFVGSAIASALLFHVAPALAKPWKGAELITQQTFRYGAFEARILAARGSGLITPFFLWKNDSEVPGQEWQEQDFEIFGRDGRYQTQLMTPGE